MLLSIHIATGALALVLGALALAVKKGGRLHRGSGVLFVSAMLAMALSAALLGNAGGGVMTIYFVGTAWMTVRPESPWTRRTTAACLLLAVGFAMFSIGEGVQAYRVPSGVRNGVPYGMYIFLAAITSLAAAGDVRVLRTGVPRGAPRLKRHLWRMCFALFIAAGSFFSIRARVASVLPEVFTTGLMRALPILLVFGAMFYWLWRLGGRRPWPGPGPRDAMPLATRVE